MPVTAKVQYFFPEYLLLGVWVMLDVVANHMGNLDTDFH